MARQFRYALTAACLLALAEILALAFAAPAKAVTLPPVQSLHVEGWVPGSLIAATPVRLQQTYTPLHSSDWATVETRCASDPKDFLKWTGRLGYQSLGFDQVRLSMIALPLPSGGSATASEAVMHDHSGNVDIVYAYLDHWGIHAQSQSLWPRAIVDLVTRHQGPYCMLGVVVGVRGTQAQASQEARTLARAFLPVIDRAVGR